MLCQGSRSVPRMADCFVHASDLHLDAPLGSLGLLDAERRGDLAERAATAWDRLVKLCIDEDASFLVLAGDIFDSAIAGVGVQVRFQSGLRRLDEAGVRSFICHGNHDPLSEGFRTVGELPASAVRFAPGEPQSHRARLRFDGGDVLVSGVSFGQRHETENLARRFRGIEHARDAGPHVAVLHANVGANPGHDPYAPCSDDDLDAAPVNYWALGHIHKREIRRLHSGARAAYCGNLQGRSFKPSECEPKGALVVPIADGRIGEPRFESCDAVRFVRSDLAVTPEDTIDEIAIRLTEQATELGRQHAPLPVVWESRLVGTSHDARRIRAAAAAGEFAAALSAELTERLGGGGLCRLETTVRTAVDREQILSGNDLRADVLRDLASYQQALASPDADTAPLHELLREGLPSVVEDFWAELIAEQPQRLDDVLVLAEELLLDVYSDEPADTP